METRVYRKGNYLYILPDGQTDDVEFHAKDVSITKDTNGNYFFRVSNGRELYQDVNPADIRDEAGFPYADFDTWKNDNTGNFSTASGGSGAWGDITGNIDDQLDLKAKLDSKASVLERFYRKADLVGANAMIISSLNNSQSYTTDIGYPIPVDYTLESMTVTFGHVTNASAVIVPIELRIQNDYAATIPSVTTGSVLSTKNCNLGAGTNRYNVSFAFNIGVDLTPNADKYLTLNTGDFALLGATIDNCLVTLKLTKNA